MAGVGQRSALGVLFVVLAVLFAAIGIAAASAAEHEPTLWVVTVAAAALALWLGSLARSSLRRR